MGRQLQEPGDAEIKPSPARDTGKLGFTEWQRSVGQWGQPETAEGDEDGEGLWDGSQRGAGAK